MNKSNVIDFIKKKAERDKDRRVKAINNILEYAASLDWDSSPRQITETLNMIDELEDE